MPKTCKSLFLSYNHQTLFWENVGDSDAFFCADLAGGGCQRPTTYMTSGRTLRVRVLMRGLYYANGVAVAADHSYMYVLVVETVGLRV